MNIVIGGCRNFNNYSVVSNFLDTLLSSFGDIEKLVFLSGHCSGVDMLAERYAEEKGIKIQIFPAEWKKYGRAAGPKRNREMTELSDVVIAFWDGKSAGTASLIKIAKKLDKKVIIKYI